MRPVGIHDAPGAEIAEAVRAARDLPLGVEGEEDADDTIPGKEHEAVVGPRGRPGRRHRRRPRRAAQAPFRFSLRNVPASSTSPRPIGRNLMARSLCNVDTFP